MKYYITTNRVIKHGFAMLALALVISQNVQAGFKQAAVTPAIISAHAYKEGATFSCVSVVGHTCSWVDSEGTSHTMTNADVEKTSNSLE